MTGTELPGSNALASRHRMRRQASIQRAMPRLARTLQDAPCVTGPGAELIPERWPWPVDSADHSAYARTLEGWQHQVLNWQGLCSAVRRLDLRQELAGHLVLDACGPAFLVDLHHFPVLVDELLHYVNDSGRDGFAWVATSGECGFIVGRDDSRPADTIQTAAADQFGLVYWGLPNHSAKGRVGPRLGLPLPGYRPKSPCW